MGKRAIDQFIQNVMEFIPDESLISLAGPKESEGYQYQMAADSERRQLGEHKIGSLTNNSKNVLVRVFKNDSDNQFELYFLAEKEKLSNYPIIFEPESFKYFIIDEEGHTSIPYSSSLDPLTQPLFITYPVGCHSIPYNELKKHDNFILDSEFLIFSNINSGDKALFVFEYGTGGKSIRLIPVREKEAKVALPELPIQKISVSIYK